MSGEEAAAFFEAIGLESMPPEAALEALGFLIASGATQKTVAAVDWGTFQPIYEARRRRPLLDRLRPTTAHKPAAAARPSLALRLEQAEPRVRWDLCVGRVRAEAAAALGFRDPETLPLREGFFQMGMDSLTSVDLKRRLELALDRQLPTTLAFEYPTVEALAGYLYRDVLGYANGAPGAAGSDADQEGLLAGVEHLSDEDARRALFEELEQLKRDLR
jgi:myxalamid-type polyketide synthase MxaE and MxaD